MTSDINKIANYLKQSNPRSDLRYIVDQDSENAYNDSVISPFHSDEETYDDKKKKLVNMAVGLKRDLLKEFSKFVRKFFENDKRKGKKNQIPSYSLSSLDTMLNKEFSKGVSGNDNWVDVYNNLMPSKSQQITNSDLNGVYKDEMDSVFGHGTWETNLNNK